MSVPERSRHERKSVRARSRRYGKAVPLLSQVDVEDLTWEWRSLAVFKRSLPWWSEPMSVPERSRHERKSVREMRTRREGENLSDHTNSDMVDISRMPVSLAPALTATTLLKFLTYTLLFVLILSYPVGDRISSEKERRFLRTLLVTVVVSGGLVGGIGVAQYFAWNGKILWFFVPQDWGRARPDLQLRASGPFVNSDHFANYLALIFPLVLGGFLSQGFFISRTRARLWRVLCGGTLFVLPVGILLSLSRGGWIGTALGTAFVLWHARPTSGWLLRATRVRSGSLSRRLIVVTGCISAACALALWSPIGGDQISRRLEKTVMGENGLQDRVALWQDSLAMIRDFPVMGVGLGAWGDAFPHYQRPPWDPVPWRQAHNDYVQGLAETGVIGMGLLTWFFVVIAIRLLRGLRVVSLPLLPLYAGLVAALLVMTFHEGFDFSLQIPANAVLFTVILAVGLRMSIGSVQEGASPLTLRWQTPLACGGGGVAVVLCIVALTQTTSVGTSDPDMLTSVAEAREDIARFPARAVGHVALMALEEDRMSLAERAQEQTIALRLEPLNPETRDRYALTLLDLGEADGAVKQVRQSVLNAPVLASHFYLTADAITVLDAAEVQAIEDGLQEAVTAGYTGAVDGLGGFYSLVGLPAEQADVYAEAARHEPRLDMRVRYLREAGVAYASARESEKAESFLRKVIELTPHDTLPYRTLATEVFAARDDLDAAKELITEGIEHGADATTLLIAFADAAEKTGDAEQAKATLQEVVTRRPSSFDAQLRLGTLYLREKNFARAVLALQRAVALRADSAPALYFLGQAKEAELQFSEAREAYAQAEQLDPTNEDIRQRHAGLLEKIQGEVTADASE